MESKFNTSFIPKKTLQSVGNNDTNRYVGRRDVYGPSFSLSLFLFVAAVVSSVGLFVYSNIVESSIEEKIILLEDKKATFQSEEIDDLIRTDTRIKNAYKLLTEHVTLSGFFTYLENITLKRIQYTEFEFIGIPNQASLLTLSGNAKNFQDVALQTEQYRTGGLRNPIVNELERSEETNDVSFSVDVITDPKIISFSSLLKQGVQNSQANIQQVQNNSVNTISSSAQQQLENHTSDEVINISNTVQNTNQVVEPVINVNSSDEDTGAFVNTN